MKKPISNKAFAVPAASILIGMSLLGSVTACSPKASPSSEQSYSAGATMNLPKANNGAVVDNGTGSYIQTTITDDDPAMKFDASKATDAVKAKYSDDQLAEAQKSVVKFIAEQTIDSTVQGGGKADEWFDKNKNLIAPEFHEDVKRLVADKKTGFVVDNPNRSDYKLKYDSNDVRVASRKIDVTKIDLASKDRPIVSANIEYALKTADGKLEKASGVVSYAVTEIDGKWLISGYESKVAIVPFVS